jgi:excisionase family DNA binding protein
VNGKRIKSLADHPEPYVTTTDLAQYWMVSRKQIYKQIEAGTLQAIRLGPRLLRIRTAAALEFERLAKMAPQSPTPKASDEHAGAYSDLEAVEPPALRVARRRR